MESKFEVWTYRWSNSNGCMLHVKIGEFAVYFHAELFAEAYKAHFNATVEIIEYRKV